VDPHAAVPVVLAGVRDEFLGRPWAPPARHWPEHPGLVGGIDLQAGGTWLAAAPAVPRVAALLNGMGAAAPQDVRRSRGDLPLRAAVAGELPDTDLARYDPFHLLVADLSGVRVWSWDGSAVTEDKLPEGVHVVVNSGWERGTGSAGPEAGADAPREIDVRGDERAAYFCPRFAAAARPTALSGEEPTRFWGEWLELASGAGLAVSDPRALVVRKEFPAHQPEETGGGRPARPGGPEPEGGVWGTSSIALLALGEEGLRYDFCARPGDLGAWRTVLRPGDAGPDVPAAETDTPG
jgi:hypothetical protein